MIKAQDVVVTAGKQVLLDACSCDVWPGEMLGICGPNGAGKSTLLRVLAGLQPLAAGQIDYAGRALPTLTLRARARQLAYLPQAPSVAWPITVRELTALGRFPHAAEPYEILTAKVDAALSAVGLSALAERLLDTLSGGERTRAHLARLLAGHPQAMLADEPTSALDPRYQLEILDLLRTLAAGGTAVAVVLHDLALAARYCDRLLILDAGKVVACGRPTEVLTPALLAIVFKIRGEWAPDTQQLVGFSRLAIKA
jgi:iron complex transport system ATP-binding protein